MDAEPKNIISVVFWERGSQGFEEPFDSHKTVDEWVEYFKNETKKMNNAHYPVVFYIQKTFKRADGSDVTDDKGERIKENIYVNKDIIAKLAHG
jgi:hypothetical protein